MNDIIFNDCQYRYANSNMKLVKRNQKLHNPDSPLLIGEVKDGDVVKEVNEPSYIDSQTRLLWFLVLQYWGMFILRENYIFNRDNLCFTCIQYYWTGPHYGRRGSLMYKIVFKEKRRRENYLTILLAKFTASFISSSFGWPLWTNLNCPLQWNSLSSMFNPHFSASFFICL